MLRKEKILAIEDDANYRVILHFMLDKFFVIDEAATLKEGTQKLALSCMNAEPYFCVLLDLGLPDSHSSKTFAAVLHAARAMPIVVISGFGDPQAVASTLAAGAADYLVKGKDDQNRAEMHERIVEAVRARARPADAPN